MKAQEEFGGTQRAHKPVRIFTLGRFLVEVNEEPLQFGRKAQRKPMDLLKVIIAMGGDSVHAETLSESLWPDADGDRANISFRTTLSRLRKLIGTEAIQVQNGRVRLNPVWCWVDVQDFAAYLTEAVKETEGSTNLDGWLAMEKALAMYQGPFLEGEFELPEVLSAREKLHSQFLRHLTSLGEHYLNNQQFTHAIEFYRKGLEIDDLSEELYQQLIRACLEAGKVAEGLSAYRRCAETLKSQIGIDPSPETEALREELNNQEQYGGAISAQEPSEVPVRGVAHKRDEVSALAERRLLTVAMFSVVGFSELSEILEPEEVESYMSRIKGALEAIVTEFGGMINQVIRNEITAVFGLPVMFEDNPNRAIRCALSAQEGITGLLHDLFPESADDLGLKAAISTGTFIARAGGSDGGTYSLTGTSLNIAARLLAEGRMGDVLAGQATERQCEGFFTFSPLTKGKGKKAANAASSGFRVQGETGAQTRFQVAESKGFTPFIGREEELAVFRECLNSVRQGKGQVVTVSGEAGLGKSRLLREFRDSIDRDAVTILEGRCQSTSKVTPYLPFLDALRRVLNLDEGDTPDTLRKKVFSNVPAIDPSLARYLPHYLHLLSISTPEHPLSEDLKEDALRREFEEALAAIMLQNAQVKPMVVILEDWHWADEASDSALKRLLPMVADAPLLLLLPYRPEYQANWGNAAYVRFLVLRPLEAEHTATIARSIWQVEYLPDGLADVIHGRTNGNPFFTEEVCQSLVEEGAVRIEGKTACLTAPLEQLHVPDTVEAVILSRVDRLEEEARETLRLASVIGREFARRLLEALSERQNDLTPQLDHLAGQDLIRQVRLLPEAAYLFKHALMQQAVYNTLLLSRRKALHGFVAQAIETLYTDRLEEHYEALAHHYSQSEDTEKAIEYLEKAGDKALAIFSLAGMKQYYAEAFSQLSKLPKNRRNADRQIDIVLKWSKSGQYSSDPIILQAAKSALEVCRKHKEIDRLPAILLECGSIEVFSGNIAKGKILFAECISISQKLGDEISLGMAYGRSIQALLWSAEFKKGLEYLNKSVDLLSKHGLEFEINWIKRVAVYLYVFLGRFEEANSLADEMLDWIVRIKNPLMEGMTLFSIANSHFVQGNFDLSYKTRQRCLELGHQYGLTQMLGMTNLYMGWDLICLGKREEGLVRMEAVANNLLENRDQLNIAGMLVYFGIACVITGNPERGAEISLITPEIIQKKGERSALLTQFVLEGMLAGMGDSVELSIAEEKFRAAEIEANETGCRPYYSVGVLRHAEVLHRHKQWERAGEKLGHAESLFRDMKMTWWLDQAKALRGRIERQEPFPGFVPCHEG